MKGHPRHQVPSLSDTPPRIVVLGSFMQACCWEMDRLPRLGETLRARGFVAEAAGKGLAVAVGCHRLGARVDLLMAIGNDAPADRLLSWLHGEGLDTRRVLRCGQPSGHGAGFIDANGDNQIVVHPGANEALGTDQVAAAEGDIASAALLYAQLEVPLDTVCAALARARAHGILSVLNPSPWQALPDDLLACTDVLVVNAGEAQSLLECPLPAGRNERLRRIAAALPMLWRRWPGSWLVVTLGDQGSAAWHRDGTHHVAAPIPARAVKTIGAGDAFSAGLCWALAGGRDMADALKTAGACGAWSVAHAGILASLPDHAGLQAMLRTGA
ncbi:ribokinase [Pigmentiphaga sp. H8]|uniref:ribokinase n=1 Tax=Pigmentiphaga sp. H8 TaxID=2488560 RepID=UPI000F5AE195|nr:ribokinase [Pigmentiphaga sp. H8]AZG10690.1 ribokinase [Pigmentiphaga sp. H8]